MSDHERSTDKWLRWSIIWVPIVTFLLGTCSGAVVTYQAFKNLGEKVMQIDGSVSLLNGWKEKQEEFNRETISSIATLKEVVRKF